MAEFQFQKNIDGAKFLEELKENGLAEKVHELHTKGDQIFIVTNTDLSSEEQSVLQDLVNGHEKESGFETDIEVIRAGISFGMDLLSELSVILRKNGLSGTELLEVAERFSKFQSLLYAGHLDLAQNNLLKIPIDDLTPQNLIDRLAKKLQSKIEKSNSLKANEVIGG